VDDFINEWHARVHGALADGLAWLVKHDMAPTSDGVLGQFVDVLCAMRFQADDATPIAALIEKTDPLLQEAGIELATAHLRDLGDWDGFEAPIARMIARGPVDSWIALALLVLLRSTCWSYGHKPVTIYRELAKRHREIHRGHGIMRNRFIQPWDELESLYAQHVIQELEPGDRETAILPILEKKLGTKGFRETQDRILRDMKFDPEEHRARLRQRP
jgi:hypothetical protein